MKHSLWVLILSFAFLAGDTQQPPPALYPVPAVNAFGTCPDAIKDHFMKDRRIPPPFEVPGSTDLLRAQLHRERDPFGQELFAVEAEAFETIPRTISHAQTVFFFALDLDRKKETGQPEPTFDLGMDISVVAQFNRGFAPRYFVLVWPVGGVTPLMLNVTGRINERFLRMEIPLATLEVQYRSVRGAALALDDPLWGVSMGYWPNSPSEEPAFDIFPERSARSPLPRARAEFIDRELLVRFKENVTPEQAQAIIAQLGTKTIRFFELLRIYRLEITDGTDVLTKVKQFQISQGHTRALYLRPPSGASPGSARNWPGCSQLLPAPAAL